MNIKTVTDLRKAYPHLVGQIEREAAQRATAAERKRIQNAEEKGKEFLDALRTVNGVKKDAPAGASDDFMDALRTVNSKES